MKEKTGIFTLNRFSTKSILVFDVTLRGMTVDTCEFDWMSII